MTRMSIDSLIPSPWAGLCGGEKQWSPEGEPFWLQVWEAGRFCENTGILVGTDFSWTRKAKIVKRDLHCRGAETVCCGIPDVPVGHSPQRILLPQVEGPWRESNVPTPDSPIPVRYMLSGSNTAQSSVSLLLIELPSRRKMLTFAPTPDLSDQWPSPPVSFLKKGNPNPCYYWGEQWMDWSVSLTCPLSCWPQNPHCFPSRAWLQNSRSICWKLSTCRRTRTGAADWWPVGIIQTTNVLYLTQLF